MIALYVFSRYLPTNIKKSLAADLQYHFFFTFQSMHQGHINLGEKTVAQKHI